MITFNKKDAEQYINKLLKKHKIEVYGWSATSCGRAAIKSRKIKIPKPTNVDRFAVCLHEIFHIIGRKGSKSFEKEFYCDMYARGILIELGYDVSAWDKRTKWHILSRIAMAHNRGLNHNSINSEIRAFFKEIDFNKWIGMKVFVGRKYWDSVNPDDIEYSVAMNKNDVEMLLNRKGLMIEKSEYDDSTYGHWLVFGNEQNYKMEFENLSEIINHYKLAI